MMSSRRFFHIFGLAAAICMASGIPTRSQDDTAFTQAGAVLRAGRNVNMVSGTTLPNGDPWLQRQNEPSIAVSTRNTLHLLAGANDYRTVDMPMEGVGGELPGKDGKLAAPHDAWLGLFKSFDGGQSWTSTLLPGFPQDKTAEGTSSPLKGFRAAADPVVRAGTNGLFYYCGIAFNREKTPGRVNSVVFIARFIDNNNVEGGDSIKYLGTKIVANDDKLQWFSVDKPWIAVDVPSNSFRSVMIDGQKIPAANVYVAYSVFKEVGNVITSEIRFLRSTDCGQTWERPIVLSKGQILNQGAVLAIDPRENGHLYVAWRRFNSGKQGSAIIIAKSTNYGKTFDRVTNVATLPQFPGGPFDQPSKAETPQSPGTSFRTNSYPTAGLDNRGIVYLAWAQRGYGPAGATRVVLTTSKDGFAWTTPAAIDNPADVLGHQFMPSLAVGSGKVTIVWYDQREDYAANYMGFWDWICDNLPLRHTIDIRVAQASTADYPYLKWTGTQVSRYLFSLEQDLQNPGEYTAYQAQFNPPNYPLFQSGTLPFHGDYIDISPSPCFVQGAKGRWRFNTKRSDNPLFHVAWTDNRDVRPPSNWDWVSYAPPASDQDPEYVSAGRPGCVGGQQPGMRNQNIYTSRITTGIETGSPTNSKVLNLDVPRAFVMFVKNNTDALRSFRLTIANQPLNGSASFLQFEPLDYLDVSIAPASTISRQVFVDSTDTRASVTINIEEIDAPGGTTVPNGLVSSLILNGDPTSPAVSTGEETHQPEIGNPNIRNWYVNPNVVNPNIRNADIINDDIVNPNIRNIVTPDTNVVNPNVVSASLFNPNIRNADLANPNIVNPNIRNPNIRNASPEDITVIDVEWPVKNTGNTASSFTFKVIAKEALPAGLYAQLIIYKVHYTPAVAGEELGNAGVDDCVLMQEPHHEVLLNVINPNMIDPDVVNPNIRNPNIRNAAIENATFVLGPGEEAIVDLRIFQTEQTQEAAFRTQDFPLPVDIQSFIESLGGAVTSQSVDSKDAEQGVTEPPADATTLIITTTSLPPGLIGSPYPVIPYTMEEARLKAVGGTEPYSWWVNPSDLPLGLSLDTTSGQIFGTPSKDPAKTYPCTYRFMAQVTDAGSPQQTHSQLLSIGIEDPTVPPPPLSIITPSPLPPGTAGKQYGTTLDAAGGTWPYAWTVASGRLPPGLVLDSGGFISGTPEAEGTYYFRIRAADSSAPVQIDEREYSLTIQAATAPTYTISGTILIGGSATPLSGVLLRGLPGAPTTNAAGFYTDTVPQNWSGTVIPFKAGYQFMPSERSYPNIISNQLNQDYTTYTVDLHHFEISSSPIEPSPIGSQTAGTAFPITIAARDVNGSTVTTYNDSNTLSDTTGTISPVSTGAFLNGVWMGNVTILKAASSVTITTTGAGKSGQSNAFSVTAGTPIAVKIEDAPDGTGLEVGAKTLGSGHQMAVYAISRDVGNNFVANEVVAWSLIDKTGVEDRDLVPATDNKSAAFTAHALGTARISAEHTSLIDDTTGIITVVETQPDDGFDANEGNDTFDTAADISLGTHKDLVLLDEDWYKVCILPADAGKDLRVHLKNTSYPDPNAYRDADFYVFNASEKLLGCVYSGSDNETLYLADVAPGYYYIGHLYMPQAGTIYNLTVEVGDNFGIGYISGRVTDRQGNGLENVFIEARSARSFPDWNVSFPMISTDANGEYKIGYLPDEYRIVFNSTALAYYNEPWMPNANYLGETRAELVTIAAGANVADINARLEEGGSISGRVTDRDGNPLAMAQVTAFNGSAGSASGAWTNANGEFRLAQLRTGNYKLRIRPNNPLGFGWYENAGSLEDAAPVSVQAGAETSGINAQAGNGAAVAGRVTDGSDNPIQGVSVNAYDVAGISLFGARTNANGEYTIYRLPPGPIKIFFNASTAGGNYASEYYSDKSLIGEADPVALQEGGTTYGIDAVLAAGGAVSGRVTDAADLPIWGVTVYCVATDSELTYNASTDASGNYLVKGLLPGNFKIRFQQSVGQYRLEWYNDRNSFAAGNVVTVAPGATVSGQDAQLSRNAGGSITGRVTDGSSGIEGVPVWVYDSSKLLRISYSKTDSAGNYSVSGIPGGDAKVFINADYPYLREASEYYNDKESFAAADPVGILEGQATPLDPAMLGLVPALEITTSSLPDGEVGVPYNVNLLAAGGRPFYLWSLASGTLPDGLTFNSKGEMRGAPTAKRTYDFSIRVIDSTSPTPQYAMHNYSLAIGAYTGAGYPVSGRITQGGAPLSGVVLEGLPGSPTTNVNGEYIASVSPGWSGTVTPTLAGFAFNPPNRTYTAVTSSFTNQDYAASVGFTISGTITLDGSPLSGVLMSGLPGSPRTNISGFYTAAVTSGWSGTVTPSLPGFTFSPPQRSYSNVNANQAGQDYASSYVGGEDDAYEENDSFAAAAELSLGTHTGLVNADEDWFKVYVPAEAAGKDLRINLTGTYFPNPNSRGDLDFIVVNSAGKLLSANYSSSGNETIFICDVAEGWYFIGQVYYELPAALYSLTAEVGDNFGIGYIEGRVTDLQGLGIEGVYVELYTEPLDWSRSFPMMTTGADGYFKVGFFPGNYTVRFNLSISYLWPLFPGVNYIGEIYNGREVMPIIAGATVTGIDTHLEPGGAISGRVLDPAGNPSNLAIVNVYAGDNTRVSVARTDANGYYNVLQLRTGNYKVRFRMGNTYCYKWFDNTYSFEDGFPVAVQSGLTTPGIDARLEQWASTEGFVEGRVTDTNGYPLQDVTVSAYDGTGFSWVSAGTDANGNYRLRRLAPGPIRIFFNASPAGGNYVAEYYPDKATLAEAVPVPIQAGQTVYGIDAQLAAGGAIAGRVTDAADNPFQTVAVTCFAVGSERSFGASTNAAGEYTIGGLLPGEYKVRFSPPAGIYIREWHDNRNSFAAGDVIYVAAGATISGLDAELTINDGGSITGRVTNGSGAGLKGVSVWVYDTSKLAGLASSETNADGYYTASKILAGEAKVFINPDPRYLGVSSEYYNNRNSFETADRVNIIQSQTTPLNDVVLAPLPSLAVTTLSLPGGEVGVPYNASLQAAGGRPFYYWSLVSGSLPDGLTLNSKGEIHGTPTVEDTFNITVRVIDSTSPASDQQSATQGFSLTVGAYAGTGYLISGRVTVDGSPLAGVVMEGLPGSPATNSNGEYVAPVSPGWSGTVTPTKASYAFDPPNRTYTTIASNFADQDYAASVGYTISGTITLDGSPLSGVLMNGLPGSPRTNLSGFYTAAVTSGWIGTVSPNLPGFTFSPPDRSYSGVNSNQTGQDYTAGYPGGAEDAFEENDDLAHAALITPGFYPDLVLNDQDWFKVNVSAADAGKDMKVRLKGISYPDPTMRRDMDFQIVSESGKLLSYNISGGDDETAYICGLAEGLYYIGNVYIEPAGSVYSLSVEIGLQFGIGYITGRVTNELGAGIPDIYVELYSEPFNWDISRPLVTTDAAGNYRVGYAPGNYTVRYNLQDFYHQDPYAQDVNYIGKTYNSNEVVTVAAGSTVPGINVVLSPGATISGRVTDPNGNGINYAGVYVYAADKRRLGFAWSNPNGDYFVDRLPTGNYKVRFRQSNRSFADEWYENTSTFEAGLTVPAQAGSTTPNINARLEDWLDVQGYTAGRVTDGSGSALSGVQVVAYDLAGLSVSSASTDGNGNYQIWRLPPGPYRIWFNPSTAGGNFASEYYPDKLMLEEAVPVSVDSGQTVPGIDAQLVAGGTITGRVTNAQGDAYPWLNVICFDVETERYYAATTDVNGNYTFRNLLPDTYKIRFRPGWNYAVEWYSDKGSFAAGDPIIVGADQTISGINAQLLQNGGFISGHVTDNLARGIPGVVVYVRDGIKQGTVSSIETGADGNYSVPRIPSGDVKAYFDADYNRFGVASEYYNDKPSHAAADLVQGVLGQTTPNINSVLAPIPALSIGTASLPNAEIGGTYNAALQATGGREFYYWSLISGGLPEGLTLNSKGVISGTPTGLGTSSFTVRVVDSTNPQQQDSQPYSLTVQAYSGSDYLVSGTVLLGGSPLPGVTLTGLPGNPVTTAQGKYMVAVSPGWSGTVTPILAGYAFSPTSRTYSGVASSLENENYAASLGHAISGTITLNGSPLQGVWIYGLPGNPRTNWSGIYTGYVLDGWSGTVTPSLAGYSFDPISRSYTNVIADQPGQDYTTLTGGSLYITTGYLPGGTRGAPYDTTLAAANGTGPYGWSVISGQLPAGLNLSDSGRISGTPEEGGDFTFTVRVTDSSSPPQFATRDFGLNISPAHQGLWTTTYPYGGHIFSHGIILDPAHSGTIYLVPLWRGIYKSQDGGSNWSNITDSQNLPFDRTNVLVLLAGSSGELYTAGYSGIFKSVDAGLNWTQINTGVSLPVMAMGLHPADPDTLYAGSQSGQVFKSTNGGLSWMNFSSGLPGAEIRRIAFDPYDLSAVYAGTISQGLFRSRNNGPWEAVNGNLNLLRVEDIVFDPAVAATIYVAGEDGDHTHGIYKTTDGGVIWARSIEMNIRWEPGFHIAIHPTNTNIVYAVCGNTIHKSSDGGNSWAALTVADSNVTCVVLVPATPGTLFAGTEEDGVLKSIDGGATWTETNTGLRGLVFPHSKSHSVHIDASNPDYIYAGSINGGYRSLNGGETWLNMNHPGRQIPSIMTHPSSPGQVGTFTSQFWKSSTNGSPGDWTEPTADFCCFQEGDLGMVYADDKLVIYAGVTASGGPEGGVYRSIDGGASWVPLTSGLTGAQIHTLTMHPVNPNVIFFATQQSWPVGPSTSSRLFRTTDAGASWEELRCGLPEFLSINQIVFYPGDPNIMYLGSEIDNGGVYRSDDGGTCWYKIFNGNVNTIAVHPANPEVVYAGTWSAGGFYVSLNGGQSWMTLNDGLPNDPGIESLAVDPRNPFHVFIGTTAGVFETTLSFDLSITTTSLPPGAVNEVYLAKLKAFGGTPPYRWEITSGSLPPGLSLNPDSGEISGLSTSAGTFDFTVRLTDNAGQTFAKQFTLVVLNTYVLNAAAEPAAGGTVTRNPDQLKYMEGTVVDVSATPKDGYLFTGWSGDASGKIQLIHVQMTKDKNITANFSLLTSLPDYYVASSSLPSAAAAGEVIGSAVSVTVGNQGAVDLYPGGISVGLYLSPDPAIKTSDILLWKGRTSITALEAGGTVELPVDPNLQIPTTITSGQYYIGVLVDEFDAVPERDEANNSAGRAIVISSPGYGSMDIMGGWPYGALYGLDIDPARNLAFVGNGGLFQVLDVSNPANPRLRSQLSLAPNCPSVIKIVGTTAFVANQAGGLKAIDISDPLNLRVIGTCTTIQNARGLDISGSHAYIADYHQGFRIIDISNPSAPVQTAFLPFPGRTRLVKVFGDYAYVQRGRALNESQGDQGVQIINISDPANPVLKALIPVGSGDVDLDASGHFLFIPTSNDYLRIYDVSDPDAPFEAASYTGARNPTAVAVVGNRAYVPDQNEQKLVILDITDASHPAEVSTYRFTVPVSLWIPRVAGNLCYISSWYDSLRIVDFSNLSVPIEIGSYDVVGLLNYADISGDHAYVANSRVTQNGLKVLDISGLPDITETATLNTPHPIYDVTVSGNSAYLPAYDKGLRVVDISNPSTPVEVGANEAILEAQDVAISGKYAYVADGPSGLRIFDLSNPSIPVLVSTLNIGRNVLQVAVSANTAYLAANWGGLRIIDVSDPLNPWEIGIYQFDGRAANVNVAGDYAYVNDNYLRLRIINVSDPKNPVEVSTFNLYYTYGDIGITGHYLFVPDWIWGVRVLDVSNPASPVEVAVLRELFTAEEVIIRENRIYVVNRDTGFYVLEYRPPINP
jgi:photosystem II stability/assembly factor-like uncharacterized protein/protocatechuate 3,4-dioxygenase beta subunit